jgi:hypothetical protein
MKDCVVKKGKKTKFTCRNENCNMHLWVCARHKDENEAAAQSFLHELKKKGLNFGFYINMMVRPSSFGKEAASPHSTEEESLPNDSNSEDISTENTCNDYTPLDFQELHHSNESKSRCDSYKEAAAKLQKQARVSIEPVPIGEPLFLFSSYKGKSKDLNLFWDNLT